MRHLIMIVNISYLIFLVLLSSCKTDKSPSLTTAEVTNITGTSAICGGTITDEGSGGIIARGVCWREGGTPTVEDKITTDGTGNGNFVSAITGLSSRTTYYVRAYATNNYGTSYGNEKTFRTAASTSGQIIADHSIVEDFDKIPASYIAEVKKMMVSFVGESHSAAHRRGMELLEGLYPAYACNVATGETNTNNYLKVDFGPVVGEAKWYTWYAYPEGSQPSASTFIKDLIKEYSDHGHPMHIIGFGWCWDMVGLALVDGESEPDPVYGCRWWGMSDGGPDGNYGWGLDAEDGVLCNNNNRVCLDTYLSATEEYISYCKANGYITKPVFTTGTIDFFTGEKGYQGYLKNERIRDHVRKDASRILFDYADILCHDDNGKINTTSWNGHTYPVITTTNLGDGSIGHIGSAGAIRLAKAQWWMLARIAGWDGNN